MTSHRKYPLSTTSPMFGARELSEAKERVASAEASHDGDDAAPRTTTAPMMPAARQAEKPSSLPPPPADAEAPPPAVRRPPLVESDLPPAPPGNEAHRAAVVPDGTLARTYQRGRRQRNAEPPDAGEAVGPQPPASAAVPPSLRHDATDLEKLAHSATAEAQAVAGVFAASDSLAGLLTPRGFRIEVGRLTPTQATERSQQVVYDIATKHHVYGVNADLVCVAVRDRGAGLSERSPGDFIGTRLVGGHLRRSDGSEEALFPLPLAGSQAVFERRSVKGVQMLRTSTVQEVAVHLTAVRVAPPPRKA